MRFRALFPAGAAALLCACASGGTSGGGPAPSELTPADAAPAELTPAAPAADNPLMYGLPSPPTATYEVTDTTVTVMNMAGMDMDMTMGAQATVALTFESGADGLVVSGEVLDFGSSMESAMAPSMTAGLDDLEGDFEIVLGSLGEVEEASLPTASGPVPVTIFLSLAHELFPDFPEGPVEAGDMWVDTVDASLDESELADAGIPGVGSFGGGGTTITTYTLVGDTVVAGRTLLHISMTTDGSITAAGEVEGEEVSQDMVNVTEASFLWDPERRIVVAAEVMNTMDGTMTVQDMEMVMTAVRNLSLRLVN